VPRIPRSLLVDLPSTNHCTFRSHNKMRLFDEETAEHFLELLARHKKKYGILIHSFCLMGTHPHVVVTATAGQKAFSAFWQVVNHSLAWYFNRRHRRRGQVVMERLRSPAIEPGGRHMLTVMRYGDMNPVRARLCRRPGDWKHSSYRHYAFGERHPLVDDAPDYLALGESPAQRRTAYRQLFAQTLIGAEMERRADLVDGPFIGSVGWVDSKRFAAGLSVPSG
jgi:putative transposase